eukprot:scaffold117489_cov75-Phaeocystis_antarctica.AAC.1
MVFDRMGCGDSHPDSGKREEVPTRLGLVGGDSEEIALNVVRGHMHRATCMPHWGYTRSLSANSRPADRSATL